MEQGKKKIFLMWVFSNKVMWSSKCFKIKRYFYKISFRMHLNLCNTKFLRIDLENTVHEEVYISQ